MAVRIGTAGWAVPRAMRDAFPDEGSTLARYAGRFTMAEINSTFYRAHKPATLQRWAATVGPDFRFALKVPRAVTHEARLVGVDALLDGFVDQALALGTHAGPLLLQLPPSLAFDEPTAGPVCRRLLESGLPVVCEPRHASWFAPDVDTWLREIGVARVAADPALHPGAGAPGGWRGLSYYRLHGSPRVYWSAYGEDAVRAIAERLRRDPAETVWCVFDNTASGAATHDALSLTAMMTASGQRRNAAQSGSSAVP